MTVDYRAIGTNLAAKYGPGVLATPASANAIRSATVQLPNAIAETPCVLVLPDQGSLDVPVGGTRLGEADWLVRLYYDQAAGGTLERDTYAILGWLGVMLDALGLDLDLGGTVVVARARAWRAGLLDYAGVRFTGAELRIRTTTSESWTPSA